MVANVPLRYRTTTRYWYRALAGRLDRELPLLKRLLRPGSRVLDVGANAGLYAYAFGRFAPVEAFEPLPEPARALRALAARVAGIRVHEVALSDHDGTAELYVPYVGDAPHSELARFERPAGRAERVVVTVRTLDGFALEDVGLLKIDVEGHERAVLAGSADTIARERPILFIEIEQRHLADEIRHTFGAVTALGYHGHFMDADGSLQPLEAFRYERHQAPYIGHDTDPRYVNDFLFIHTTDERSAALLARERHHR
jgi:FkbM family methyltransferase